VPPSHALIGVALSNPLTAHADQFCKAWSVRLRTVEEGGRPHSGSDDQEAPRPRRMVAGVCHKMCMSHQKDQDAT
jgi:hypothetical protein